jgi:hypothetical protein
MPYADRTGVYYAALTSTALFPPGVFFKKRGTIQRTEFEFEDRLKMFPGRKVQHDLRC